MRDPFWTLFSQPARWIRKLALLVLVPAFILLSLASPAQAHPTLLETLPKAGFSYAESPVEIGLVFDEPVGIQRLSVHGQARGLIATSDPSRSPDGTKIIVTSDEPLLDGNYTVRWQIAAEDGDIVDGAFDFGVGVSSATALGVTGDSDTVGLGTVAVLRWVLFGGIALALGGLAGDAMVRDRVRRARSRLEIELPAPRPWVLGGSMIGLVAVFGLALVQTGGGNLLDGVSGFSVNGLTSSDVGWLLIVEAAGFSVSTLAAMRSRRDLALAGLIPIIVAEAWRSHLHADSAWLGSATIGVHLAIAALWVGVLTHLVRTAFHWRDNRRQVVALFRRYAKFALAGYLAVVTTGTVAAILVLPSWGALTSATYGRVLLIKLSIVALVSCLALAARQGLRRPISTHQWGGLRFARPEIAGLIAVLGTTALLTAVSPAPASSESSFPTPVAGPAVHLGDLAGQVSTGLIASDGRLQVRLHVPESSATAVQRYRVRGRAKLANGKTVPLKLKPCGTGCFTAPHAWPQRETTIDLSVRADGWEGGDVEFAVPWPPRDGQPTFRRMLATMSQQPKVLLAEQVTSNTQRPEGMSSELRLSGTELLKAQPYRSGIVDGLVVLNRTRDRTELGFALTAEAIYVRMTLDRAGRIRTEKISAPNHLISRTYTYPAGTAGR